MCLHYHQGGNGLQTSNWAWVKGYANVEVNKNTGEAHFKGGHLEIPLFRNQELRKFHVTIRFKLSQFTGTHSLLDNGSCKTNPTFSLYANPEDNNGFLTVHVVTSEGEATLSMAAVSIQETLMYVCMNICVYTCMYT